VRGLAYTTGARSRFIPIGASHSRTVARYELRIVIPTVASHSRRGMRSGVEGPAGFLQATAIQKMSHLYKSRAAGPPLRSL